MSLIGTLAVNVMAKTEQLQTDLKKGTAHVEQFAEQVKRANVASFGEEWGSAFDMASQAAMSFGRYVIDAVDRQAKLDEAAGATNTKAQQLHEQFEKLRVAGTSFAIDTAAALMENLQPVLDKLPAALKLLENIFPERKTFGKIHVDAEANIAAQQAEKARQKQLEMEKKFEEIRSKKQNEDDVAAKIAEQKKFMDEALRESDSITQKMRTPKEIYEDAMLKIKTLRDMELVTAETMQRAVAQYGEEYMKTIKKIEKVKESATPLPDLASKAFGSQEAFASIARAQNHITSGGQMEDDLAAIERMTEEGNKTLEAMNQGIEAMQTIMREKERLKVVRM